MDGRVPVQTWRSARSPDTSGYADAAPRRVQWATTHVPKVPVAGAAELFLLCFRPVRAALGSSRWLRATNCLKPAAGLCRQWHAVRSGATTSASVRASTVAYSLPTAAQRRPNSPEAVSSCTALQRRALPHSASCWVQLRPWPAPVFGTALIERHMKRSAAQCPASNHRKSAVAVPVCVVQPLWHSAPHRTRFRGTAPECAAVAAVVVGVVVLLAMVEMIVVVVVLAVAAVVAAAAAVAHVGAEQQLRQSDPLLANTRLVAAPHAPRTRCPADPHHANTHEATALDDSAMVVLLHRSAAAPHLARSAGGAVASVLAPGAAHQARVAPARASTHELLVGAAGAVGRVAPQLLD